MKNTYIAVLKPNGTLEDGAFDLEGDSLKTYVFNAIIDMVSEFASGVKVRLDNDSEIFLLINNNGKFEKIKLVEVSGNTGGYHNMIKTDLMHKIEPFSDILKGDGYWWGVTVAFTDSSEDIGFWDYTLAKLSEYAGDYGGGFYIFGKHPDFGDTIVTQGYCEGEWDTGICCDFDVESYGGPQILPEDITEDMFSVGFYSD